MKICAVITGCRRDLPLTVASLRACMEEGPPCLVLSPDAQTLLKDEPGCVSFDPSLLKASEAVLWVEPGWLWHAEAVPALINKLAALSEASAVVSKTGTGLLCGLIARTAFLPDELSAFTDTASLALALAARGPVTVAEPPAVTHLPLPGEYTPEEYRRLLEEKEQVIARQTDDITELNIQYNAASTALEEISGSFYWRSTKPLRACTGVMKKGLSHCRPAYGACVWCKGLLLGGPKEAGRKFRVWRSAQPKKYKDLHVISSARRAREEAAAFEKDVLFSILVPLYNTPENFLREMIRSVREQTYGHWELCLADGSDEAHARVGEVCRSLAEADGRIKYQKLKENGGISRNTNACLDMAAGDYLVLFDHDDFLHPSALYKVMKAICEQGADFIYTDEATFVEENMNDISVYHFKPDFAPDNLRANNYICHLTTFSRGLFEQVGPFDPACDGSQDFDMVLRLTEKAEKIVHIPELLYFWRAHKASVASEVGAKPYVIAAAHRALENHLSRCGLKGTVTDTRVPSMYKIDYEIEGNPKVSILIPNKDHVQDLDQCLRSIDKSTYKNYEIIVIENNSTEEATFAYYETLAARENVRVVTWKDEFNYSAINNFGASFAGGDYLLLLNNDVEILTEKWLEEMLMFAQRKDVGAVGVKLNYPDDTVQHGGICLGMLTLAAHYHRGFDRQHPGYMGRLVYAQDVTAVTAACMMMRRDVFNEVGGLDEKFKVAFNDVDLCMRIREKGYLIVFTPFAELYHYESKSRGQDDVGAKRTRFVSEVNRFRDRCAAALEKGDPYYNPNLSLDSEDFTVKIKKED